MNKQKVVLEILVDRLNEKWALAFEHILRILYKVLDEKPTIFQKATTGRPCFSFEIAHIWNKIRFFFITTPEYKNFLTNQIYAHYSNVEIVEVQDYLANLPDDKFIVWKIKQWKHFLYPIKNYTTFSDSSVKWIIDPFSSITSALNTASTRSINIFQVNFSPLWDEDWKKDYEHTAKILFWGYPKFLKKLLLTRHKTNWYFLYAPFIYIFRFFYKIIMLSKEKITWEWNIFEKNDEHFTLFKEKIASFWYWVDMNLVFVWDDKVEWKMAIKELYSTLWVYSVPSVNSLELDKITENNNNIKERNCNDGMIMNTVELAWLVHLPTSYVQTPSINWIQARWFEPPSNLPLLHKQEDLTPIWKTNFRWSNLDFWIGPNDRRRHMYIVWKTWMWKSTILENMILDDIHKWRWVAVIDPHWDLAETVLWNVPKSRTNDVVIFDPSDTDFPVAFNMLEDVKPAYRPLIASWLVGIFKKIFGDSWWPRLEHILRNTILALLEYPNTTLISIPMMLTTASYREKVVAKIKDPIVKKFWVNEFGSWDPKNQAEYVAPVLNKVGQFLSSPILRNVLWQPKNSFGLRWAMDNKKIVIINLSKWKIWEDASSLLWAMLVTKFQIDAMSRADIWEKDRKDFYLYVDEFQNFATESFASILSEARKYKLNLVMANQYIEQMPEDVRWAVFWNVWSMVTFQVGYHDWAILKEVLWWEVEVEDLVNLRKYTIYTKLLVDWMPTPVFSADTFPPKNLDPEVFSIRYDKIFRVSREKYCKSKKFVEDKINSSLREIETQEKKFQKRRDDYKEKMKKEKQKKHEALLAKQAQEKAKRLEEEAKIQVNVTKEEENKSKK